MWNKCGVWWKYFFPASSLCPRRPAEARCWWYHWYLSSQAHAHTSDAAAAACDPLQVTISSSLLRKSSQCRSLNNGRCCTCLSALHAASVLFRQISCNNSEPTHCFVLAGFISGYCSTSWDTLSLMRKTLYKHPAYLCLYCSFSDLSLIRRCSLWDITLHRKLAIFQASSSLDSFLFFFFWKVVWIRATLVIPF